MGRHKIITGLSVFAKLLSSKIYGTRYPLIMNILITNKCNLSCYYCFPEVFNRKIANELSYEEIISIIDQGYILGTRIVVLLGGEPLVRPDISLIIQHIKSKGMICEVITNGYFYEKNRESLKLIDSLCVSIDGDKSANDRNRGEGSFDKAINCLRIATLDRIKTRIHTVITKDTISSIEAIAKIAKLEKSSITYTFPAKNAVHPNMYLSRDEIHQSLNLIKKLKLNKFPVLNTIEAIDYCLSWELDLDTKLKTIDLDKKHLKCLRSKLACYIDADGTMRMCPFSWSTNVNIRSTDLQKAWESFANWVCMSCAYLSEVVFSLMLNLTLKSFLNSVRFHLK